MDEKKKLIDLMLEDIQRFTGDCFICEKMGFKCPVNIPDDYDFTSPIEPNFGDCNFREQVYKTLTIEH